jgi:hypothetical protein
MTQNEQNRLADELAIRNLEARYCDAVIRRDADAWESTWAEDSVWEFMGQNIEGRDNILTFWKQAMDGFPMIIHQYFSGGLEINGDQASCRWYILETVLDIKRKSKQFFGVYNDDCVRIENDWFFMKRRFDLIYQGAGLLDAAGWQGYPQDLNRPI